MGTSVLYDKTEFKNRKKTGFKKGENILLSLTMNQIQKR